MHRSMWCMNAPYELRFSRIDPNRLGKFDEWLENPMDNGA